MSGTSAYTSQQPPQSPGAHLRCVCGRGGGYLHHSLDVFTTNPVELWLFKRDDCLHLVLAVSSLSLSPFRPSPTRLSLRTSPRYPGSISDHSGSSRLVKHGQTSPRLGLSRWVLDCPGLSRWVLGCPGLSRWFLGCPGLSRCALVRPRPTRPASRSNVARHE